MDIRNGMIELFIVEGSRSQFTCGKEGRTNKKYLELKAFGFSSDSAMNIITLDNLLNPVTFGFTYRTKAIKVLRPSEHWPNETLHSKRSL